MRNGLALMTRDGRTVIIEKVRKPSSDKQNAVFGYYKNTGEDASWYLDGSYEQEFEMVCISKNDLILPVPFEERDTDYTKHDEVRKYWERVEAARGSQDDDHDDAKVSNPITAPAHYTWHPRGIECKDVVGAFPFHLGSAIKYIWRSGRKGDAVEDLEKAIESIKNQIREIKGLAR